MKKHQIAFILFFLMFINACSDDSGQEGRPTADWLIPSEEVRDGGPGKDGIPALEDPDMISKDIATYLEESDLVVGFVHNGEARAYSHKVLDWHEIANDNVNGKHVAITYCPLTGTATAWNREINGSISTFGVSGLLYNTNLIPYDRATDSNWTQIGLTCVNGDLIGDEVETYQVIETTWETWKTMYPNTLVTSTNTGHSRNYERYPYGSYQSDNRVLFPVSNLDERLHPKERVHGIISAANVKAYRFEHFSNNPIIIDEFDGKEIVLVGSPSQNFIMSFEFIRINRQTLDFSLPTSFVEGRFTSSVILTDQFGNEYDAFGKVITGPNTGESLTATESFMGFWFSWAPFYGEPEIYEP